MNEDVIFMCGSCGHKGTHDSLVPAKNLMERFVPGDMFTDVECPVCGALCHPSDRMDVDLFNGRLVRRLAKHFMWVQPAGAVYEPAATRPKGFVVCRRAVKDVDGDTEAGLGYLLKDVGTNAGDYNWSKTFIKDKCMFDTMEDALSAAALEIVQGQRAGDDREKT